MPHPGMPSSEKNLRNLSPLTENDGLILVHAVKDAIRDALESQRKALQAEFDKKLAAIVYSTEGLLNAVSAFDKRMSAVEERAPIPGPKGLDGRDGIDGKDGKDGIDGKNGIEGKEGPQGTEGPMGQRGESGIAIKGDPGLDGKDGRDGRDGKDGINGRDAAELEILSSIDLDRSYAPGTFAQYKGGLIRSLRQTDPIYGNLLDAGWKIVLNGSEPEFTQAEEDPRQFFFKNTFTDGTIRIHSFRIPIMLYTDIWQRNKAYQRGDVVTYGGNGWVCLRDNPSSSPADAKVHTEDWRLFVKKGRDGNDAK